MHKISRDTLKRLGASEAHIAAYEAAKLAQPCGVCRAGYGDSDHDHTTAPEEA